MNAIDFQLHTILLQIQSLGQNAPAGAVSALGEKVQQALTSLQEKRFRVAVMGEFKRGKSSLINALLGMSILPVGVEPTTATVNRITYGLEPKAIVHYRDGRQEQITVDALPDYVTKWKSAPEGIAETVWEAEIQYPLVLCANNVDIIDTPGLNDEASMTAVVEEVLTSVDAVIFAVSASLPYSDTECDWVARMIARPQLHHVAFAVTCIDRVRPREREKLLGFLRKRISEKTLKRVAEKYPEDAALRRKAEGILAPEKLRLYPVSALQALEAFDNGDGDLLQESNFPQFKKELVTLLNQQQQRTEVARVGSLVGEMEDWLQNGSGFRQEIQELQRELQQMQVLQNTVNDYFEKRGQQIQVILQTVQEAAQRHLQQTFAADLEAQVLGCFIRQLGMVTASGEAPVRRALELGVQEAAQTVLLPLNNGIQQCINGSILRQSVGYLEERGQALGRLLEAETGFADLPGANRLKAALVKTLSVFQPDSMPRLGVNVPGFLLRGKVIDLVRMQVGLYLRKHRQLWERQIPGYVENAVYTLLREEPLELQEQCLLWVDAQARSAELRLLQTQQQFRQAMLTGREARAAFEKIEKEVLL